LWRTGFGSRALTFTVMRHNAGDKPPQVGLD